jgi:hypothetical protein
MPAGWGPVPTDEERTELRKANRLRRWKRWWCRIVGHRITWIMSVTTFTEQGKQTPYWTKSTEVERCYRCKAVLYQKSNKRGSGVLRGREQLH